MTFVGSRRKSGINKPLLDRRRNQTSNSNVHSINPLLSLGVRNHPSHQGIAGTRMRERKVHRVVDVTRMSADMKPLMIHMKEAQDGEGRMALEVSK